MNLTIWRKNKHIFKKAINLAEQENFTVKPRYIRRVFNLLRRVFKRLSVWVKEKRILPPMFFRLGYLWSLMKNQLKNLVEKAVLTASRFFERRPDKMSSVKNYWKHNTFPPSFWCNELHESLKKMLPPVLTTRDGLAYRFIIKASIINKSSETLSNDARKLISHLINIAIFPERIRLRKN